MATAKQNEAACICNEADSRVIVLDGAYRSSKTQAGARVLVEWAIRYPSTYLVARATYRSLKDSTQAALLRGDGGLPALIPSEVVEQYRASDEMVTLRNGSIILFRSLEEGQVEKLRGLTLGGILVDQLEELDSGPSGEHVYDTLLGRLSDPAPPASEFGGVEASRAQLVGAAQRARSVRTQPVLRGSVDPCPSRFDVEVGGAGVDRDRIPRSRHEPRAP